MSLDFESQVTAIVFDLVERVLGDCDDVDAAAQQAVDDIVEMSQ